MSSFQKGLMPGQQSLGQPMICAAIARGKKQRSNLDRQEPPGSRQAPSDCRMLTPWHRCLFESGQTLFGSAGGFRLRVSLDQVFQGFAGTLDVLEFDLTVGD